MAVQGLGREDSLAPLRLHSRVFGKWAPSAGSHSGLQSMVWRRKFESLWEDSQKLVLGHFQGYFGNFGGAIDLGDPRRHNSRLRCGLNYRSHPRFYCLIRSEQISVQTVSAINSPFVHGFIVDRGNSRSSLCFTMKCNTSSKMV